MNPKKRVFTILSIDSGGVRGIIPARILQEIEEKTGKPIAELFDMVSGTSTGAIIAAGLTLPDPAHPTKPKFSAKDMLNFYFHDAPKIFPEMRFKSLRKLSTGALYDPKPLEDIMARNFKDAKMRDALTSLLIPVTDIKNFRPVWITHLKGQKDTSKEGWGSMLMREAIRATTSAPTYFPAKYVETTPNDDMPHVKHRHVLIDGGFFAGNAIRHLLTKAKKLAPPDAEIVIVHIGTGDIYNSFSPEEFNALGPLGLISKANGSVLINLMTVMPVMDVQEDMREEIEDRFFSFDKKFDEDEDPNSPSADLDDASEKNMKRLHQFAELILRESKGDMERLCDLLTQRKYAEARHDKSLSALQSLHDMLADTATIKSLTGLYTKIVLFSTDIEDGPLEAGDVTIQALSKQLTEHHKAELDRMYRVLLDKKKNQSKILNTLRETGESLTEITKKIFVDPFKEDPPPDDKNEKDGKKPPPPPMFPPLGL